MTLTDGGGPDGAPHPDLSVRCFPPLLRQFLAGQQDGRGAAEEIGNANANADGLQLSVPPPVAA